MARLSGVTIDTPDTTAINLTVLLERLHAHLDTPGVQQEHILHTSQRERDRLGKNLDYARTLLIKLEQDAQHIKIQSRKQQTQLDLVKKREQIIELAHKLDEYTELAEDPTDDDSEGEDLLGEDTPSEDTRSQVSHPEPASRNTPSPSEDLPPPSHTPSLPPSIPISEPPPPTQAPPPPPDRASNLRARHAADRAELLTPSATTPSISTGATEALLSHHRTEQEDLTASLLAMARQLKHQSNSFNQSLEEEKNVLDSAAKGLDRNELGLETAQRKMGYLRKMSEGKGWWGRMMMYAWIAGLMVVAILVVFVLPKLRF